MSVKSKKNDRAAKPDIRFYVPPWADPFPPNYSIEIIHRGIPDKKITIPKNNIKFVVGRATDCDGVLGDIMVSKYHMMFVYGITENQDTRIWCIDLESQNKSKINKTILVPNHVYPLNDQDVIQLADNEFTLIVHYPKIEENNSEVDEKIPQPFKIEQSSKIIENMKFKDSKKISEKELVLSYFERKGMDFDSKIENEESNKFKYHAYVELPIYDENSCEVFAHAYSNDRSKIIDDLYKIAFELISKYDSVFEAETFNQRKKRELAENDYYDDEDDIYFDRSGQVESKRDERLNRMNIQEKNGNVETYKSMNVKLDLIRKDIQTIDEKISKLQNSSVKNEEEDELDQYMNTIQDQIDENVRTRYQDELKKLKEEEKSILEILPKLAPMKIMETEDDNLIKIESKPIVEEISDLSSSKQRSKRKSKPKKTEITKKQKSLESNISQYCDESEELVWNPPENQSGDGVTDLNKKYGY